MKQLFTRRGIEIFPSLLSILFIGLLIPRYLSAEVVDKVVAVVNDEVITLSELQEETSVLIRSIAKEHPEEPIQNIMAEVRAIEQHD